jgi:hypothetical protein
MRLKLKWHGAEVAAVERIAAARGLMLGAEHVLEEANRIVPISPPGEPSSGTLLRSGTPSVDVPTLRAAVSYDTPYAVRQHEEMSYQHDPGRQAKYLETPVNASDVRTAVNALIARELKTVLGA